MEPSSSPLSSSCPSIPSSSQHEQLNADYLRNSARKPPATPSEDGLTKGLLVSGLHILGKTGLLTLESTRLLLHSTIVDSFLKDFQAAVNEYVSTVSPQRLNDWGVIFTSSLRLIREILWEDKVSLSEDYDLYLFENEFESSNNISRSQIFRYRLKQKIHSLLSTISSTSSRQLVIDLASSFVKGMEALHTPECRVFIQHLTVLVCRVVDVQSSSPFKQLVNDFAEFVWSGISLGASPEVCSAIAEICANIVHALEMENEVYQKLSQNQKDDLNLNDRMRRRRERGERWSKSYGNETLHQKECDPTSSIETAILSSLGDGDLLIPKEVRTKLDTGAKVGDVFECNATNDTESASSPLHTKLNEPKLPSSFKPEIESNKFESSIDVDLLRREISQRYDTLKTSAENLRQHISTGSQNINGEQLDENTTDNVADIEMPPFLSQVDDILTKKRQAAIDRLLKDEAKGSNKRRQQFFSKAAAAAGIDNEYGQQTLKAKLFGEIIRNSANIGIGSSGTSDTSKQSDFSLLKKYRLIFYIYVIIALVLFFLLWTLMAFYGIYALFFQPNAPEVVKEVIYVFPNASTIELLRSGNALIHEEL